MSKPHYIGTYDAEGAAAIQDSCHPFLSAYGIDATIIYEAESPAYGVYLLVDDAESRIATTGQAKDIILAALVNAVVTRTLPR